jgi:hypothetical protein
MNRITNTKNKRAALKTVVVFVAFFIIISMMVFLPEVALSLLLFGLFCLIITAIFSVFKAEDDLP